MASKKFEQLALSISTKEIPCLWENEGKLTENYGQAFIITNMNAKAKKPLYIRQKPKPNSGHALIPVKINDMVIVSRVREDSISIQIYSITSIDKEKKLAEVKLVNSYEDGAWDVIPSAIFDDAIEAAKSKAKTKECMTAFYVDITKFEKRESN